MKKFNCVIVVFVVLVKVNIYAQDAVKQPIFKISGMLGFPQFATSHHNKNLQFTKDYQIAYSGQLLLINKIAINFGGIDANNNTFDEAEPNNQGINQITFYRLKYIDVGYNINLSKHKSMVLLIGSGRQAYNYIESIGSLSGIFFNGNYYKQQYASYSIHNLKAQYKYENRFGGFNATIFITLKGDRSYGLILGAHINFINFKE
jgi:hypothetical protein